jgi:hypothetical protein
MWNMKQQQYKLEFIPSNLNVSGLTAALQDNYLGTSQSLNLNNTDSIIFTVDNNVASSANNRFQVVFNSSAPLPVTFVSASAHTKTAASIQVDWTVAEEKGIQQYEIDHSTDGINFSVAGAVPALNNTASITYNWLDTNAVAGVNYYRIKSIGVAGDINYSNIIKATIASGTPDITIYPNPVTNGHLTIRFSNQPKGAYSIRLINMAGQIVYKTTGMLADGNATESLDIPSSLASGTYKLEITTADNTVQSEKIIINK